MNSFKQQLLALPRTLHVGSTIVIKHEDFLVPEYQDLVKCPHVVRKLIVEDHRLYLQFEYRNVLYSINAVYTRFA